MPQNKHQPTLDENLIEDIFPTDQGEWDPGFDVNRQLVISQFAFYENIFLRPERYVKRFYHTLYPILVQDWDIVEQLELYDGFCSMDIRLKIRFQATLNYIEQHINLIDELNQHIKSTYENQLFSVVHHELNHISDGAWLKEGLGKIETKISKLISETFILHHIQAHTLCILKPNFKEFPHLELTQENIHLNLTKKEFEMDNKNQQELYHQEFQLEENKQQQKRRLLQQLERDLEIERRKLVLEKEHERLILVEKEGMQMDYFAIKERLSAEELSHENRLQEIDLEAKFTQQHAQREAEKKELLESITYRQTLAEKQLSADVSRYEQQQHQWLKTKERVYLQKLALIEKQEKLKAREQQRRYQ